MKIMDERAKYESVWRECAQYGKNWADPGLGRPYKRPFLEKVNKGASAIDFGCGNGTSLTWLNQEGLNAYGVEIAENAVMQNKKNIVVGDLRDPLLLTKTADYGLCTDVMEHIPTEDVPIVIENISKVINKAVLFGIARLPDKDGDALGLKLHLTICNKEWWDKILLLYFNSVESVRYDDGVYIVWAIK